MPNSCSYCGDRSHNIRSCGSPSIDVLYGFIKMIFMDLLSQPLNNEQRKLRFSIRLHQQFNVSELKAVAVKYIGLQAYLTKAVFVEKLWFYYLVHIQLIPEQQLDFTEDQEPIILVIDRTPTNDWIQAGLPARTGLYEIHTDLYEINNYQPEEDEFIPFTTNNLLPQFDAEAKKFDIVPLLLCMESREDLEEESDCAICYESTKLDDAVILNCKHQFCHSCIKQTLAACNNRKNPSCALCREPMAVFIVKNQTTYNSLSELCKLD